VARALLEQQRFRDAERICHEALAAGPETAEVRELIGRARVGQGDLQGGARSLARAVELDGGLPTTWAWLAAVRLQLGEEAEATSVIAAGLDRFPDDPELQAMLAARLLATGHVDDALAAAERALTGAPDCTGAHRTAAAAAIRLQAFDRAAHHCRAAIATNPLEVEARRQLALVQHERGERDGAIATLEEALAIEPAHPQALDELAGHYHRVGRHEAAAACWERLAALHPDRTDALEAAGRGLAASGQHGSAARQFARAARDPGADPRVWLELSTCLEADARPDQALTACDQYLALCPDDNGASRLRERLVTRLDVGERPPAASAGVSGAGRRPS
jgi:tetratricopeptide (TPR) repeat protein